MTICLNVNEQIHNILFIYTEYIQSYIIKFLSYHNNEN